MSYSNLSYSQCHFSMSKSTYIEPKYYHGASKSKCCVKAMDAKLTALKEKKWYLDTS